MPILECGFLLLLLGAWLLPDAASRRASALAAIAAGLATAGLRAGATPLPPGFLAVDGALFVLAVILAFGSTLLAGRPQAPSAVIGAGALVAGAIGLGWGAREIVAAAPKGPLLLALVALTGLGVVLLLIGRFVHLPPAPEAGKPRASLAGALGLLTGTVTTAAGPHLSLVVLGVILAAWSGWLLQRARGGPKVPLAPVLTLLLLLPAWWLMATIAGPEGLAVGALPLLPTSPAAERLLAPLILVAAWATTGLWPLHRHVPPALLAPVGALLLARVAIPAFPNGLEHWRSLAMPMIVLGIWHAALSGRLTGVGVGLAWIGLLGASREGLIGAALLLTGALALELTRLADERFRRWSPLAGVASALAAGAGALLAVESGLGAEVVYTVLAVGGVAMAAGRALPSRQVDGALKP